MLLGLVLDLEDRKVASNRMTGFDNSRAAPRCQLETRGPGPGPYGTAGVLILANAVNNLLQGTALALGEAMERAFQERACYEVEYRVVRPDGETRVVVERVRLHTGSRGHARCRSGRPGGAIGLARGRGACAGSSLGRSL